MEPRAPTAEPEGHGGMIVMVRPDPVDSARALATDLHAELILGTEAAMGLLSRLDAEVPPGQVSVEPATRPIDATLDELTVAMRRAEAVRDATRTRAAEHLASTLNTRVAIHPDTVRRAAMELVSARHALADREAAEDRARRHRRWAVAAGVLTVLLLAGGGAALALGVAAVGLAALGALAGVALLTAVLLLLLAARSARPGVATAELRLAVEPAERRWAQVSPAGTPPEAVEDVIHRYEPQHRVVAALVGEHPAVRAADRAAVARRMAWVGAWREALGDDAPLATGPAAHRLHADLLRDDEAEVVLPDLPDTPGILVVASPYDGLADADALRLHRHLLDPPGGRRVIVILSPDPVLPSGARLPGPG